MDKFFTFMMGFLVGVVVGVWFMGMLLELGG